MIFDFKYYKNYLLITPLIFNLLIIYVMIVLFTSYGIESLVDIFSILIGLMLFVVNLGKLKHGIFLVFEDKKNVIKIKGKIENIKIVNFPFIHKYKYLKRYYKVNKDYAHYLNLSGVSKKLYSMAIDDLNVNDFVEVTFLTKSRIILKIEKI